MKPYYDGILPRDVWWNLLAAVESAQEGDPTTDAMNALALHDAALRGGLDRCGACGAVCNAGECACTSDCLAANAEPLLLRIQTTEALRASADGSCDGCGIYRDVICDLIAHTGTGDGGYRTDGLAPLLAALAALVVTDLP